MNRKLSVLLGMLLVVASLVLLPIAAAAQEATPDGVKTFESPPQAVELAIDPTIDPQTVSIVVIAPNGARADQGVSKTTAQGVRSTILRPGLGAGDYLVYWISGPPGTRPKAFGQLSFRVTGGDTCLATPDATPQPSAQACLADPPSGPPDAPITSDGISVTLSVSDDKAGPVDLVATVTDASGAPLKGAAVTFRARHLEMDHGELPYLAAETSPGVYQASGVGMGMGGNWRIAVDVIPPDQMPITVFVDQTMVE